MRTLLIALLTAITMQAANAEGICKKMRQSSMQSLQKEVDARDWSCGTTNIFRGPELEIFNHTEYTIDRIELKGDKTWGRNTLIPSRTSQTFRIDNPRLCQKPNLKLKLFYTKFFRVKEKCLEYYTAAEIALQKQNDARAKAKAEVLSELQSQMNRLRDNCIISKGKNAGEAVMQEIRRVCTEISKNPSAFQKFRWGS